MKNCSSRSHSTRTSLTVQTTKYPIGYLICPPTSNALCACMRVHIPRKSLVVVALILESCEVSGSRKQPQIMSILCYATTYSTCLNKWVVPCSEYLFSFCSYRMFLTNYNERRSIIYHVISMILFYLLRAIRAFIRACAVAPEQIGRKVTKKNRHSQG